MAGRIRAVQLRLVSKRGPETLQRRREDWARQQADYAAVPPQMTLGALERAPLG